MLTFVPWQLTIEGKGALLPEDRQNVYAPVAGIVQKVEVEHGQFVKAGTVLCELESKDLQKELTKLVAAKQEAESQYANFVRQVNNQSFFFID